MTFATENLNVIAYANGWTLWNYISNDKLADICSENYFAEADNDLRSGDIILVSCKSASFFSGAMLIVAKVDNKRVTTAQLCVSAEEL